MRQKRRPHDLAHLALTLAAADVAGLEGENKGILQPLLVILCQNGIHATPHEALLSPAHQQRRQRHALVTHTCYSVHITALAATRHCYVHRVERHLDFSLVYLQGLALYLLKTKSILLCHDAYLS